MGEQDASTAGRACGKGHGQRPADRPQVAFETHLTDHGVISQPLLRQLPAGHQNAERDRQIEGRAVLADVRGCQVHSDAAQRERKAGVGQGGADPLSPLLYRTVRQTDRGEGRKPVTDVDLDVHRVRIDPEHGGGADAGEHGWAPGWGAQPYPGHEGGEAIVDRILQQIRRRRSSARVADPPAHRPSVSNPEFTWVVFSVVPSCLLVAACAMPKAGAAPVAPVERAWAVPTLELYQEWWTKTEECSGLKGDMTQVTFYAVDSPSGAISLAPRWPTAGGCAEETGSTSPPTHSGEEWLVRHEMLHALLQRGTHPAEVFVTACHLASVLSGATPPSCTIREIPKDADGAGAPRLSPPKVAPEFGSRITCLHLGLAPLTSGAFAARWRGVQSEAIAAPHLLQDFATLNGRRSLLE